MVLSAVRTKKETSTRRWQFCFEDHADHAHGTSTWWLGHCDAECQPTRAQRQSAQCFCRQVYASASSEWKTWKLCLREAHQAQWLLTEAFQHMAELQKSRGPSTLRRTSELQCSTAQPATDAVAQRLLVCIACTSLDSLRLGTCCTLCLIATS